MNNKTQLLLDFYKEKFHGIKIPDHFSSPLLLNMDYEFINSDIMFVGQETNSYYGNWYDFELRGIENQMDIYKKFMHDEYPRMNNLFFQYIKKLIDNPSVIPVWNNLFKFDLGDNSKKRNISHSSTNELTYIQSFHNKLLAKEVEIIRPKLIIFFTGHAYDKLYFDPIVKKNTDFRLLYNQIEELQINNIDEWKCCTLNLQRFEGFENFTGKAIRTYHPLYLNRTKYKDSILKYIKHEIKQIIT
jgi:hypothetical protein